MSLGQRLWAPLAGVLGFVMVGIYLVLVLGEGNNSFIAVAPWVVAMSLAAVLALIGAVSESDRRSRTLLLFAAVIFLVIGVVSIFSLGIGFLVAGALALFAANDLPRPN